MNPIEFIAAHYGRRGSWVQFVRAQTNRKFWLRSDAASTKRLRIALAEWEIETTYHGQGYFAWPKTTEV